MGSTRLPGKVMKLLADRPVLEHVLNRCRHIANADIVVCAIPDEEASEPIEALATRCGARVYRGSEHDVLSRYLGGARAVGADVVMRVTSDCPLIDPEICSRVLSLRQAESADYAGNVHPRSFPQGLDCEAFTASTLEACAATATESYDREHVTPWMTRAPNLRRANLHSGRSELAGMRWTLDYSEDLDFLQAVLNRLPRDNISGMDEILRILKAEPELAAINARVMQASGSGRG